MFNKIDSISLEQVDKIAREDHSVVISCEMGLNLDGLLERIWEVSAIGPRRFLNLRTSRNWAWSKSIRRNEGTIQIFQTQLSVTFVLSDHCV